MASKNLLRWLATLSAFSLAGLAYLVLAGYYVRPGADDLWYMSYGDHEPHYTYHFLNGRITSIILYGLIYSLPYGLQIVPLISIGLLLVSLFVFIRALLRPYTESRILNLLTASLASAISLAVCILLPGLYVSLYWFAAAPVHTWSVSLALLIAGLLIEYSRRSSQSWKILSGVFLASAVVIGCLSEVAAGSLLFIGALGLLSSFLSKNRQALLASSTVMIAALISFSSLLFSPGAVRRRAWVANTSDQSGVDALAQLPGAMIDNLAAIPDNLSNWPVLLAIFAITLVVATTVKPKPLIKHSARWTVLVLAIGLTYILLNTSLVWLGLHELQPLRSYFSTTLAVTLVVALLGYIAGQYFNHHFSHQARAISIAAGSMSVALIALFSFMVLPPFGQSVINRSQQWDERSVYIDTVVRESNCTTPINPLPIKGMWAEGVDPNYWMNQSLASYYNLPCNPYTHDYEVEYDLPEG